MEVRDQIECLNLGVTGELVGPFSEQEVPNRQAQGPRHGQASARSQSSPLAATMTYPISPRRPLIASTHLFLSPSSDSVQLVIIIRRGQHNHVIVMLMPNRYTGIDQAATILLNWAMPERMGDIKSCIS